MTKNLECITAFGGATDKVSASRGTDRVKIIEPDGLEAFSHWQHRDVFYDVLNELRDYQSLGHAVCLVGLRRTGKTVVLNQLHWESEKFGIKQDEILHLTLGVTIDGKPGTRNDLDVNKLEKSKVEYPACREVEDVIFAEKQKRRIKCILIDEITLCPDLILAGKGFVDWIVDSGILLVFAGTESLSFDLANHNSLYTRLILKDMSYIPFGEYCRVKRLPTDTLEEKQAAMDKYVEHGNVLDNAVLTADQYLKDAVGVNFASSIINADTQEFYGYEDDLRDFVSGIIKYYKLIGETVSLKAVKAAISHADVSRALYNEGQRRKRAGVAPLNTSRDDASVAAINGAENYFKHYGLSLDRSVTGLTASQLEVIDNCFTNAGLLYCLCTLPDSGKYDDICVLHSLSYQLTKAMTAAFVKDSDDHTLEAKELGTVIESTAYGRILENIVVLNYVKRFEASGLYDCVREYAGHFRVGRKCTLTRCYKYSSVITVDAKLKRAEVDLIVPEGDTVDLIEIKKSKLVNEHQYQWLKNDTVCSDIDTLLTHGREQIRKVYYLGEPTMIDEIEYINIVDFLLEEYQKYFYKVEEP